MLLMGLRHMLIKGSEASLPIASLMTCHPPVLEQDLDCACRNAYIYVLPGKLVGYRVTVAVDLDMVVDIYFSLFPACIFIGRGWKGL